MAPPLPPPHPGEGWLEGLAQPAPLSAVCHGDPLSASAQPQATDSVSVLISISGAAFGPTKCLTVIRCCCVPLGPRSSTPALGFSSGLPHRPT